MSSVASFTDWLSQKPDLMRNGLAAGRRTALAPDIRGVVVAGMGGSGSAGRLVRDAVAEEIKVPLLVVQDGRLPGCVDDRWVALALSYSGETEETLAVARAAGRRGAEVVGFSTGGALANIADVHIRQPSGYAPRAALGFMWMSVLGVLERSGLLDGKVPIEAAVAAVHEVDRSCAPHSDDASDPALTLAAALRDRIPCIYATPGLEGVARFMAALLNENAKRIAFDKPLPEANHNDLVGWCADPLQRHLAAVVLRDAEADDEMTRRLAYMRTCYQERDIPWHEVPLGPLEDMQARIVAQAQAIQLAERVSLRLADGAGVDPGDIAPIDGLKRALRMPTRPSKQRVATTHPF